MLVVQTQAVADDVSSRQRISGQVVGDAARMLEKIDWRFADSEYAVVDMAMQYVNWSYGYSTERPTFLPAVADMIDA